MEKQPKILCKILFGSHLYGTSTPESDLDYKGVFMPSIEDLILQRVPKVINLSTNKTSEKNTKDDIDYELYSLPYFLKLACEGQTVALDMLHADGDKVEETSGIWGNICNERSRFYTKNLQAFIGYARKQAAKYGIKGSRLNSVQKIVDMLKEEDIYSQLKMTPYKSLIDNTEHMHEWIGDHSVQGMEVCGKKFQETTKVEYVLRSLTKFLSDYGSRARDAAENKGVDWKALSHALRAAYQVQSILIEGEIIFPLPEADFLTKVKAGEYDYLTVVAPTLEQLMDHIDVLSEESDLPDKVDREYWDRFLVSCYDIH